MKRNSSLIKCLIRVFDEKEEKYFIARAHVLEGLAKTIKDVVDNPKSHFSVEKINIVKSKIIENE